MTVQDGPLRIVSADTLIEAPAAVPAPARARQPITIELRIPIQAHAETVTSLRLRVPTPDDFEALGELPLHFSKEGFKPNVGAINNLIVRLAGIPRSSVSQLDPHDHFRIVNEIVGFLAPPALTS